jgi:hypothetical protein
MKPKYKAGDVLRWSWGDFIYIVRIVKTDRDSYYYTITNRTDGVAPLNDTIHRRNFQEIDSNTYINHFVSANEIWKELNS